MPPGGGGHRCDSQALSSVWTWHAETPEKGRVPSTCSGAVGPEKEGQEETLQAHIPLDFPSTVSLCCGRPWQELMQPTSVASFLAPYSLPFLESGIVLDPGEPRLKQMKSASVFLACVMHS